MIISWIINAIAIYLTAMLLPGVSISGFVAALILSIVLGLINALLKPLILLLTLPVNILTLGLFTLVINTFLIMLADNLVDGFTVNGFWWALLFSLVLSAINSLLQGFTNNK